MSALEQCDYQQKNNHEKQLNVAFPIRHSRITPHLTPISRVEIGQK